VLLDDTLHEASANFVTTILGVGYQASVLILYHIALTEKVIPRRTYLDTFCK